MERDGRRWYDEWKVKVSLLTGLIGLTSLIATATFVIVLWVARVGATPELLSDHTLATRTWQREHLNEHALITDRLNILTEIVWCSARFEGIADMDRCLSDHARRTLERQLPR